MGWCGESSKAPARAGILREGESRNREQSDRKSPRRGWPRHTARLPPAKTLHPGDWEAGVGGESSRLCSAARKHSKTPGFVEPRLRLDFGPAPPRDPRPGIQERLAHRGPPMGLSPREPWEQPRGKTPALWLWAGAYPEGGWESTTSPVARKRPRPKAGGPVLGAAEATAELAGFGVRAARTWHRTFRRRRRRCPAPPRCVCWVWTVSGLRVDAKSRRVGSLWPKLGASLGAAPG